MTGYFDGPHSLLPLVFLVAAVACTGCSGSDRPESVASIPEGAPVAVADSPRLTVGVLRGDSAEQFHGVATPFLHRDSLLVVPVGGDGTLRAFGPDGELLRSLGGSGEGPGEFRRLAAAWPRGDAIEAFDPDLGRVTRFTPAGSTDVVSLASGPPAQSAAARPLADGWVLYGVESGGMGRRDTVAVHHFGSDGSHRGVITRVEGFSRYRTEFYGGPDPLSPKSVLAVRHGLVYVGETLTPRIRVLSPDGELRREITWEPDSLPAPEEAFATVVEAAAAGAEEGRAETVRKQLGSFPVPDRVSAFWGLLVDEEGFVWVERYDPSRHSLQLGAGTGPGAGGEWLILTPAGERAGTVRMPEGLTPVRVTGDAVVGIHRDELGVERVRVHGLRRRSR